MTTLQNSVQKCETLTSFEEIFHSCYSHGLESIYKLENVDLKSVRKLTSALEQVRKPIQVPEEWFEEELKFDLGPFYREWMSPYIILEPIQVLQLAKPIEKTLLGWGLQTVGALQKLDLHTLKMGQGHIEEIRQKLGAYIAHKPLHKTRKIDFLSLIKCLCAAKEPCKVYVTLASFGLASWMLLTPTEAMEVKKCLTKRGWIAEMHPQIMREAKSHFPLIVDTWVKPWMLRRGGIATVEEIEEFLTLQSSDPFIAEKALKLFGEHYETLIPISSGLAMSKEAAFEYHLIELTIKSYFVNPCAQYLLSELIALVLKELAQGWHDISEERVKRFLQISSNYKVFRNGAWFVQLAILN